MAQPGRANLTIYSERLNGSSKSDRDSGAGCRTECVPGHPLQLRTTTAHVWQGTAGQAPRHSEDRPTQSGPNFAS